MRGRAVVWGAIVVIGAVASIFTVSSNQAVKWNDKVVAIHARFGMAWARLQPLVESWATGKTIDAGQMDSSFAQYSKDIAQAAAEVRRETPPDDELCKAMHAEILKYADLEEAQPKDLGKLIGEMKASNPGKAGDLQRVTDALEVLGKKEAAQEAVVDAKQKAMAVKFKIKLK